MSPVYFTAFKLFCLGLGPWDISHAQTKITGFFFFLLLGDTLSNSSYTWCEISALMRSVKKHPLIWREYSIHFFCPAISWVKKMFFLLQLSFFTQCRSLCLHFTQERALIIGVLPLQCLLRSNTFCVFFQKITVISVFKNKNYTVSRILLETLLDIAKCFLHFCPGIWHLVIMVPLSQVIVFVYVFSDHRLA